MGGHGDHFLVPVFIYAVYGICVLSVPACGALIGALWGQVRNTRRGVFARQLMHLTVADLLVTSWVLGFELRLRPRIALETDAACAVFKAGFYALYAVTFLILVGLAATQAALLLHRPALERAAARAVPLVWCCAPLVSAPTLVWGAHLGDDGYCHGNVVQHVVFSVLLSLAFLVVVVVYAWSLRVAIASNARVPARDAPGARAPPSPSGSSSVTQEAVVPRSAARRSARRYATFVSIFWVCWAPYVALKLILIWKPLDEDQTRWLDWFTMVCYSSQGLLNSAAYGFWHRSDRAHRSVAFARPPNVCDDFDGAPPGEAPRRNGSFACPRAIFGRGNLANLPDDDDDDDDAPGGGAAYRVLPGGDENQADVA